MKSSNETGDRRGTWRLVTLAAGDVLTIGLFAALGRTSHNLAGESPLLETLRTALPFWLGWLAALPVMALASRTLQPHRSVWRWLALALLTGLLMAPAGVALRMVIYDRPWIPVFLVVTTGTLMLMLAVWRTLFWAMDRRIS